MLIRSNDSQPWHAPKTTTYNHEGALKDLIAGSPTLLPGVEDEAAVAATEVVVPQVGKADVVVVDRDGEITIVECKLERNPEIRRWVIGQVFSYAAGVWQLSYEDLERAFAARGKDLAASFDGVEAWEKTTFREAVEDGLKRGAFRLVIAVDEITDELKRTIVYVNRHTTAELQLLALELQYAADSGVEILVDETYGEESATEPKGSKRVSDERTLIEGLGKIQPPEIARRMIRLYEALRDAGAKLKWGTASMPSVTMWLSEGTPYAVSVGLFAGEGVIAVNFDFVRRSRPPEEMARLAGLLRGLSGVAPYLEGLEESEWRVRPSMDPERILASDEALKAFKDAIIEASNPPTS
jgi:hypothetical protein